MAEAGYAAVLPGNNLPARVHLYRVAPPQLLVAVKLVVFRVFQDAVGVYARLMGEGVSADTGLVDGDGHVEGVLGKLGYLPGFSHIDRAAQLIFTGKVLGLGHRQNNGHQVGVARPLPDAVDGGVDVGVLPAVNRPFRPGQGVSHRHPQVAVAMLLDGQPHLLRQRLVGPVDGEGVIVTQRIAVPQSGSFMLLSRQPELDKVVQVGPGGVLGVDADALGARSPGGVDRRRHVVDNVLLGLPALELTHNHLVGGGYGNVQVFYTGHPLKGRLHVVGDGSYPAPQADGLQHPHLGQLQVGFQIAGLVLGSGEAELGLKYPDFIEVDVGHRLFQLRKPKLGGLYSVTVSYIK
ncbi:hypothetical protein ES708_00368 [subsurface metagenome]